LRQQNLNTSDFKYIRLIWAAEGDLANGKITGAEFNEIDNTAELKWLGE
jgi:hypothetical protein